MATIVVTEPGTTVAVKNGDRVEIAIPGGGDVTLVAANPSVRQFQVSFGGDDVSDSLRIDLSTFRSDGLQVLLRDYDSSDRVVLEGSNGAGISGGGNNDYDFTYTGSDGGVHDGRVRILDPGERDLTQRPPPIIICFAAGTCIATDIGPRPVEGILPGDLVVTADHGLQPVRWSGQRAIDAAELAESPHLAPVLIRAGAMGQGLPWTDLLVSPQHRIRISDWRAELLFGEAEVLVPAKALIDGKGIVAAPVTAVTYCHLLFDRHEIVLSNGLFSESLHPGEMAVEALGPEAQIVLAARRGGLHTQSTARLSLRYREALALGSMAA